MTDMEVDMVADMEVDMVAIMEVDIVAAMEVDMVAKLFWAEAFASPNFSSFASLSKTCLAGSSLCPLSPLSP